MQGAQIFWHSCACLPPAEERVCIVGHRQDGEGPTTTGKALSSTVKLVQVPEDRRVRGPSGDRIFVGEVTGVRWVVEMGLLW